MEQCVLGAVEAGRGCVEREEREDDGGRCRRRLSGLREAGAEWTKDRGRWKECCAAVEWRGVRKRAQDERRAERVEAHLPHLREPVKLRHCERLFHCTRAAVRMRGGTARGSQGEREESAPVEQDAGVVDDVGPVRARRVSARTQTS